MKEREIEPDKDEIDYLKKALKFFIDSSSICWSSTALDQTRQTERGRDSKTRYRKRDRDE